MKDVLTPIDMRATDKNTQYNAIPTLVLMENAGSRIADFIVKNFPDRKKVSIYSGTGGNGGDGFVIARHLLNRGYRVRLFMLARKENIRNDDSRINFESVEIIAKTDRNLSLSVITDSSQIQPDNSDIIVDAILGTGVSGKLRQPVSSAVDAINYSPATVLSVDVPSGMDPETGEVPDKCVVPKYTLTLHKKKTGLIRAQQSYTGEIVVLDIGIPRVSEEYVGEGDLIRIPIPRPDSHKGQNGSVLIVGSNPDYVGAVVFAAEAALSRGVDLLYIMAPESSASVIKQYNPEFIVRTVDGDVLTGDAYDEFARLEERVDAILIGPGSGRNDDTGKLFNRIVSSTDKPLVIDADALKLVDRDLIGENVIVTPHASEFGHFFGTEVPEKLEDKIELLQDLSGRYGATILLKGVVDVISSPDDYKLNRTGNQGMTMGGTGDLLAGLTLALACRNTCFEAAYLASFILCSCADRLAEKKGFNYSIKDLIKELDGV